MKIEWKDEYSVGHPELDKQHKHLLHLLNLTEKAGKESANPWLIHDLLQDVADAFRKHIGYEEGIMAGNNCPDYDSHKKQHIQLSKNYSKYISKAMDRKNNISLFAIIDFLSDSWIKHILEVDIGYKDCISSDKL